MSKLTKQLKAEPLISEAQQSSSKDDDAKESSAAEANAEEPVDSNLLKKFCKFSDDADTEALLQSLTTGQILRKPESDSPESDHEYEKAVAETSCGLRPKGKTVKGKKGLKLREHLTAKSKGKTVSFCNNSCPTSSLIVF